MSERLEKRRHKYVAKQKLTEAKHIELFSYAVRIQESSSIISRKCLIFNTFLKPLGKQLTVLLNNFAP